MCRADDVCGKNVLTCTFFMHDSLVAQEIKKCTSYAKDSSRLALRAFFLTPF